jgi:RNA polymerase sigma-70 factor (ECF subfamily)
VTDQRDEDGGLIDAVRTGSELPFVELTERYRRELRIHCYRMLGSFDEAEDLTQETFLRAWRRRDSFEGRSSFRAWLYRIATNACLDFLDRSRREPVLCDTTQTGSSQSFSSADVPWLQPFPDRLMEPYAPPDAEPDARAVARETIELAFLAAIQHLPPRQRAAMILRDVLGWPAAETADSLGMSVAGVKSALQRARSTMRSRLPERRLDWAPTTPPTQNDEALLRRFMAAHEQADPGALAELLSEDVRLAMPPLPYVFVGRSAVVDFAKEALAPGSPLFQCAWRGVVTGANRQPAVGYYVRHPGEQEYRAQVLDVLDVEGGLITAITAFEPRLLPAFDLPATLKQRV